ncbi:hypothetical protein [Streptomyces sp. NPDC029526]|uniref:hypothetical protein n=1 Tax=Streptomyces sp. NPDC029526 TaxID=3155728 RepID=UPI0033FAE6E9
MAGRSAHGVRVAPGAWNAWGGARSPDGGPRAGQGVDDGSAGDRDTVSSGVVHGPGGRAGSTSTGASAPAVLRCGPEVSSPEGIEAQTCVVARGEEIWGRAYYRNATGTVLSAILVLLAPGGSSVRVHCAVEPGDEPAVCETPRRARRGAPGDHEAVTEFAGRAGPGPLLLRSGSNPPGD